MPQATFSVRMDPVLKQQFDVLCSDFGMNASTAINIFARAVVRERRIPFEICSPRRGALEKSAQAFEELRAAARLAGVQDMPLEEINEEIRRAHRETGNGQMAL